MMHGAWTMLATGVLAALAPRLVEGDHPDAGRALMSTNSCTAALNCACLLAGAGPGTEVIAPSFTYVAAHQAITATGAECMIVAFSRTRDDALSVGERRDHGGRELPRARRGPRGGPGVPRKLISPLFNVGRP